MVPLPPTVVCEEEAELERLTEAAWSRLARLSAAEVAFSWVDWQTLSPSLQRRLLRRAGQELTGRQGWSFRSVEAGRRLLEMMELRERSGLDLIACPSCGRAEVDVIEVATRARQALEALEIPI